MKRSLAYITAAWRGDPAVDMEQAAHYCRVVYDAGYFDYEAYGRDVRINEDGHFAPGGYVLNNGGKFIEHYHGVEDIPAEHKVFAFPQLSVREQMAAYKEIIDGSSLEGYRKIAKKEHEER